MKIGKIKRTHRRVPKPIIIILPKPETQPIPAPDIFKPKPVPVEPVK